METGKEPLSEQLLESLEKKYQIYLECPNDIDGEIDFFLLLDKEDDTPNPNHHPQYNSSYVDNNFFVNNASTVNTKYSNPKYQYHASPRREDANYYNNVINVCSSGNVNNNIRNSDLTTNINTVNNSNSQMNSNNNNNLTNLSNANTNTNNSFYSFNNYGLNNINSMNNISSSSPGYNAVKGYGYSKLNEEKNTNNNNTPEKKSYFAGKKSKAYP